MDYRRRIGLLFNLSTASGIRNLMGTVYRAELQFGRRDFFFIFLLFTIFAVPSSSVSMSSFIRAGVLEKACA